MIKVNLLPKEIEKKATKRGRKLLLGSGVLVVVTVLLGIVFLKAARLGSLQKSLKRLDKEISLKEVIVKKVDELEKEQELLAKKINIIKGLAKNRLLYPKLLEDLARLVPPGVWLNSLTTRFVSESLSVTIEASAFSNYDIADFMSNLASDKNFSNVELMKITTQRKEEKEETVRKFVLTCVYKEEG